MDNNTEQTGKVKIGEKQAKMNKKEKKKNALFAIEPKKLNVKIIIVAVLAAVAVFLLTYFNTFSSLDFWINDKLNQTGRAPDLPIVVVGIDDKTTNAMGQPYTWNRDVYAKVMDKLHADPEKQPSVVTFDILFQGDKDSATDKMFADACEKYKDAITGVYFEVSTVSNMVEIGVNDEHKEITQVVYPYDSLKNVTTLAFTDNGINEDGYFRELMPYMAYGDQVYESLALVTYKKYYEKTYGQPFDASHLYDLFDRFGSVYFTYTTKPYNGKTYPFTYISMLDLLEGPYEDGRGTLPEDGCIVMIGAYAVGLYDDFFTPADHSKKMFGVDVHANLIEAIAKGLFQVEINKTLLGIIYALITAALIIFAYMSTIWLGALAAAATILIDIVTNLGLFPNGSYLKIVYLIIPAIVVVIVAFVMHYLSAKAAKDKINNAFKMYVAPEIVDEMASSGDFELKLGGQTKDIAVLFIDIRGFTTMSEKLEPEEVVSILNEYFGLVTDAIFRNKGTLDKFVGDAAMAVYNSPNDLDDYVYRAVHTGWDILLGTQDLQTKLEETHHRTIGFGIGVNCGQATIGNIGSSFRMDFTAIGDTVNTSARLEANAKAGQILISQDVLDRVSDWVEVEKVEGIKLKGKSNEFNIYNVTKVIDKPGYIESGISVRK